MTLARRTLAAALFSSLLMLCSSPAVAAVACSITGSVKVEPLDSYYCDTSSQSNCGGWLETDLDSARGGSAKPMRYMRLEIWQGSTYLGKTHTNVDGTYGVTVWLPGSTCAGQNVTVQHWMQRIHENDTSVWPPRYRFSVVAWDPTKCDAMGNNCDESQMLSVWRINKAVTLTGSWNWVTHTFTASTNPGLVDRLANVYYTTNSAISEIKGWSSRLDGHFANTSGTNNGIFRVMYGPDRGGDGGGFNASGWGMVLGYDAYNVGIVTRHELGHGVREALHDRICGFTGCTSYNYNFKDGYDRESCEYGSAAFNEGIASFFGVRSITYNDTNVWECTCRNNTNQDVCSETSNGSVPGDGVQLCADNSGTFVAVGDRWIVDTPQCKRVKESKGCTGCTVDGNGYCASSFLYGWRNIVQVNRFMWDIVDTNNESQDTIDYSAGSLISAMQGMPTGFGVDGSCRESERAPPPTCNPVVNGDPPTGGTGSRDTYNPRDISDLLPENLSWVMALNCVGLAPDN